MFRILLSAVKTQNKLTSALLIFSLNNSTALFARFHPTDSEYIDREERLSTEHYNDILSYKNPNYWDVKWRKKTIGYKSNYGSLDVSNFYFREEIKISFQEIDQFGLHFKQTKHEERDKLISQKEINISAPLSQNIYLSILFDGDSKKQYGDVGTSLSYGLPWSSHYFSIKHWSIDHYYNTKKDHEENKYTNNPYSLEINYIYSNSNFLILSDITYDSPLYWQRNSESYHYYYENKYLENILIFPIRSKDFSLEVKTKFSKKNESKHAPTKTDINKTLAIKELKQISKSINICLNQNIKKFIYPIEIGFFSINRHSEYLHENNISDELSPSTIRKEIAVYYTQSFALRTNDRVQWGLHYNNMKLKSNSSTNRVELKFQSAYDFKLNNYSNIFINLTWDLDEVYRERNGRFRPWGGGNIQFMATL